MNDRFRSGAGCRQFPFALAFLVGLFAVIAPRGYGQAGAVFRITGLVVSERGNVPVPKCHLSAMRSGEGAGAPMRGQRQRGQAQDSELSAETDSVGRFSLDLPSAGSWQLYAYARGFRRQPFDGHEGFFSAVVLTAAAPTYDLVFRVEPDSAISGFVLDEAGEGVRNARLALLAAEPASPDLAEAGGSVRSSSTTDDRGHYEFAGLAPGNYIVAAQAEPWYAAGGIGRRFGLSGAAAVDPQLDVVYPATYFPGVSEKRSAEVLSLHHGEVRQADFHLTPIPATHLHISAPLAGSDGAQRAQFYPQVERVSNEGNPFVNATVQNDGQGQIDVGGLSPGLYRITLRGPGGQQTPSFIRVPSGESHSLDLSAAVPVAELTLHFDKDADTTRIQVVFTDLESGSNFVSFAQGGGLQRRRNASMGEDVPGERKIEVPPGRYRVTLNGDNDVYLAGISTKAGPMQGRVVTVGSGPTALELKLTHGRAGVRGVVTTGGEPLTGAMVMLVPATYGQPGSIDVLRRDQTNTDGGFLIENVIPGDYILLAIDQGWSVNWRDPSTLARYLLQGIPLTLSPGPQVRQDVAAQKP